MHLKQDNQKDVILMYKLLIICLLLISCDSRNGRCVELTDGSGRTGIIIEGGYHTKVRMRDTNHIEVFYLKEILIIENQRCLND